MEVCVTGAASVALVCLIHTRPQHGGDPACLPYLHTYLRALMIHTAPSWLRLSQQLQPGAEFAVLVH
jgi:hypothetical protein